MEDIIILIIIGYIDILIIIWLARTFKEWQREQKSKTMKKQNNEKFTISLMKDGRNKGSKVVVTTTEVPEDIFWGLLSTMIISDEAKHQKCNIDQVKKQIYASGWITVGNIDFSIEELPF